MNKFNPIYLVLFIFYSTSAIGCFNKKHICLTYMFQRNCENNTSVFKDFRNALKCLPTKGHLVFDENIILKRADLKDSLVMSRKSMDTTNSFFFKSSHQDVCNLENMQTWLTSYVNYEQLLRRYDTIIFFNGSGIKPISRILLRASREEYLYNASNGINNLQTDLEMLSSLKGIGGLSKNKYRILIIHFFSSVSIKDSIKKYDMQDKRPVIINYFPDRKNFRKFHGFKFCYLANWKKMPEYDDYEMEITDSLYDTLSFRIHINKNITNKEEPIYVSNDSVYYYINYLELVRKFLKNKEIPFPDSSYIWPDSSFLSPIHVYYWSIRLRGLVICNEDKPKRIIYQGKFGEATRRVSFDYCDN